MAVLDRARLAGIAASHGLKIAWHGAVWPLRRATASRLRPPVRLLMAPQDIRTSDPTVAADIYAGYFIFDGKTVNLHGRSPFASHPPSPGWAERLASFGWLRHLRAADTSLARINGRALVGDWINVAGRSRREPDWRPEIVARRLLAWLSQSPLILDGADAVFYRRFMRSVARHAAVLQDALRGGLAGEARLVAAIGLAEVALCAEGLERPLRSATRYLVEELGTQILADGGHVSRNPGTLVELLLDLLPLRQTFMATGTPIPPPLNNAIDRMMPMVRTFRHGDGTLALFNGMGRTPADDLATVLAYDDARGRPLANTPYSGYQRLEAPGAVAIADTGRPPPVAFAGRAHAGTLAFEFSVGAQRLIVNCGVPPGPSPALSNAARATAAHSTLVLDDLSSSLIVPASPLGRWLEGALYAGPRNVPVRRTDECGIVVVEAWHDGYLGRFGLVHHRRLMLDGQGRLRGDDRLSPPEGPGGKGVGADAVPYAIRFHLHHAVRVQSIRDGAAVALALPNGELWVLEAGGLPLAIEESILFAGLDGPRRTDQIVIRGSSREMPAVSWSLAPRDPD